MVMSSAPQQEQGTVDESAVRGFLADTASAVKAMKASWLRVALNLKRIRDEELWNYATPACENFEDYAFGVLKLNKYVARRMLKAMDYTSSKRPDMVDDVSGKLERGEEVVVPSYQVVNNLSGGNQQKVSIGKWLAADCDVLIIDEPTVGVDLGAKAQIHRLIWDLAAQEGKAIILISSDMPEIISLAGRILVFKEKQIVHEVADIQERSLGYDAVSREIGHHLN